MKCLSTFEYHIRIILNLTCAEKVRHYDNVNDLPEITDLAVMAHFKSDQTNGQRCRQVEGELYSRQLAVAHELEALEAKAVSVRGGTLCEEDQLQNLVESFVTKLQCQNMRKHHCKTSIIYKCNEQI